MSTKVPERRAEPSPARVATSWIWALSPGWTLGLGTAPAMFWASVHKGSWPQGAAAVGYLASTIVGLLSTASGPMPNEGLFTLVILVNLFVGLIHSLSMRRQVFDIPPVDAPLSLAEVDIRSRQQAALAASRAQGVAREEARELVESDPMQALRLQVGRVDIPRRAYPDGGLIDVNNVSGAALAEALGIGASAAERLVRARAASGGFTCANELSVLADLPPHVVEAHEDVLIFLPKRVES